MRNAKGHGFNQFTRMAHDFSTDMIDSFVIHSEMKVIMNGGGLNIRFHTYVHDIIVSTRLLMGVVTMMSVK